RKTRAGAAGCRRPRTGSRSRSGPARRASTRSSIGALASPPMLTVAAGAICGIAAGIVAGIGARSAMRMVADGVPDPIRQLPSFTIEGTAAIVIVAALAGAPFGAVFGLIHDALPGPRRARGFIFGIAMLVTVGPLFFTGTRDEFITYERMALFSFLFP